MNFLWANRYLTVVIDHDTGKVVRCAEAKWSLTTDALDGPPQTWNGLGTAG